MFLEDFVLLPSSMTWQPDRIWPKPADSRPSLIPRSTLHTALIFSRFLTLANSWGLNLAQIRLHGLESGPFDRASGFPTLANSQRSSSSWPSLELLDPGACGPQLQLLRNWPSATMSELFSVAVICGGFVLNILCSFVSCSGCIWLLQMHMYPFDKIRHA